MSILFGAPIDNSADGYPPMTYYNINNPYEINNRNSFGKGKSSFMDRNAFSDPISLSFDANIPLVKKKEQVDDFSINSREYFNGEQPMPEAGRYNDSEYYNEINNNNKKGIMNTKYNDGQHYKSNDVINNVNLNIKENKVFQIDRKSNDFLRDNINDQIKKKFIQDANHEPDNSNCKVIKSKTRIQKKKINNHCNISKSTLWNIIYLLLVIIGALILKILYDHKIISF